MPGRQGVTVPSHADDALWSLTRVSGGLDPVNVPPVAAFHTPSRFFLPPGLDKPTAAAETPAAAAAPQSRFPPGRFGRALRVDRTAPFQVQLDGPGAASQGPAGTIEFWLKPEATPDGRPAGALWRRFRAGRTTTGLYARNATLCLEGKDGNRSWPYYPYFGLTRLLEPEHWQHVAVCWDFSKRWIALYVNGAGQAIAETWVKRLDADDWSAGFDAIGFLNVPGVSPLTGDLDEIRVSSAVRYPGGFVPAETPFEPDADTVLLLHLDGGLEVESGSESLVGKAGFAEGP